MTAPRTITVDLLSDAAFARGEPTAGEVDVEVEHDKFGLPFLGGKTLHGLLRDTWLSMAHCFGDGLNGAAVRVLGAGGDLAETAILRVGDATVPDDVSAWVAQAVTRRVDPIRPADVLGALTDVRYQTAENRETGAPARATLRATRVVLRDLRLHAPLRWLEEPTGQDLRCLALCALGTRHAGLSRNRGLGHVQLMLDGDVEATRSHAKEGA
ncbi:MAG: RAMP superfamily CRISPR-associated protein [Egibacteraceae bacterium]